MSDARGISNTLRVMRCSASGLQFCLDMDWVLSVEKAHKLQSAPEDPSLAGFLTFVGERIDVYPAGPLLGRERNEPREDGAIVIVQESGKHWGLLVDRVYHAMPLPGEHLTPLPDSLQRLRPGLFRGMIHLEGEPRVLLAPNYLHPDAGDGEASSDGEPPRALDWPRDEPSTRKRERRIQSFQLLNEGAGNGVFLALSSKQVVSVVDDPVVVPLPYTPPHVLGALDWRGVNVNVLDVGMMAGCQPLGPETEYHVAIARPAGSDEPCGIPVGPDAEEHALPIDNSPVGEAFPLDRSYALGVVDTPRGALYIPDLAKLLAA